jgi:hypothetical protein
LQDGGVRVVLVLDRAPQELVRLVGFLEAVTHGLSIDLVTVTSYQVGDRTVVVPQREEPDRPVRSESASQDNPATPGRPTETVPGWEAFAERVEAAAAAHRPTLDLFVQWAARIADAGLADVHTFFGKTGNVVLLPRIPGYEAGLVSLYLRPDGRPALQWWRTVFERRAPGSIAVVEAAASAQMGQGSMAPAPDAALLDTLFDAYAEANSAGTLS